MNCGHTTRWRIPAAETSGRLCIAVAALCVLALSQPTYAFPTGITTQSFGALGCNQCHSGGATPVVTLSGPTEVAPDSTSEYTLQIFAIGSQTKGGLNVSTVLGTLATGGSNFTNTQVLTGTSGRGEVTHTSPKAAVDGVITFTFLWTAPSSFTSATLNAWGNAVNGVNGNSGDRAAFDSLTIVSRPAETATPTDTPTAESTASPTATPSPTDTPTPAVTATPGPCIGDCGQDGTVTVAELVTGVRIALDRLPLGQCPEFDVSGDEAVTVDELVAAVNAALNGCRQ